MKKNFRLCYGFISVGMLFALGCDENPTSQYNTPYPIPTEDNLPPKLRSLSDKRSLQQPDQQQRFMPQQQSGNSGIDFNCASLKHKDPLCKGMCQPNTNKKEVCEPATISDLCKGKSPAECMKVPQNRCMVDLRGTDTNGNPYNPVCVDNKAPYCHLDTSFDLDKYCEKKSRGKKINNHDVCTSVANTQTCTQQIPADKLCQLIAVRAAAGEQCTDIGLGLGTIKGKAINKYTIACTAPGGGYAGAGASTGQCGSRAASLCTDIWDTLAPDDKTEDNCEAIAVLPNATTLTMGGQQPIEGAPGTVVAGALANQTAHAAAVKPCRYSGNKTHGKPDLTEFLKMCDELPKSKCGAGQTEDICKWSVNAP